MRRDMPREERFGVGAKIDSLFLETFEILRRATYATEETKTDLLQQAIENIDSLRFFVQLAWEMLLLTNTRYSILGEGVENIGRMVGGWRKGLLSKTPAP
ncbi:MAG: four helix bundle protein [Minisyncoccia bacterium]